VLKLNGDGWMDEDKTMRTKKMKIAVPLPAMIMR
jgi:hypothetical protein